MNWSDYDKLKFEGVTRSGLELLVFAQEKANACKEVWEKAIWDFVLDWLQPGVDYVEQMTSGSTGTPKVIQLSKSAMLYSAMNTLTYLGISNERSLLLAISAEYIGGKMMIVRAILGEHELCYTKPTKNPLENFEMKDDIALMAVVPYQLEQILEKASSSEMEKIHHIIVGGAPFPENLKEELPDPFPFIHATYGMTETCSHVALKPLNHGEENASFKLLSGITGNVDYRGCLVLDCPALNCRDLATNDLVRFSSDKEFEVLGRFDNIINSGGVKINPEPLEVKLREIIDRPFFISWLPNAKLGQAIVLIIEGSVDKEMVGEAVNFMNDEFDRFQKARAVSFVAKFLRTPTGKLRREATRRKLVRGMKKNRPSSS